MERLCKAKRVSIPITNGHKTLISYERAVDPDALTFPGIRLDPSRKIPQHSYAFNYLKFMAPSKDPQTDNARQRHTFDPSGAIDRKLYEAVARPEVVHGFPFGNKCKFSTKVEFTGLTLWPYRESESDDEDDADLEFQFVKYTRECYQFPNNTLTTVSNPDGTKIVNVLQQSSTVDVDDDDNDNVRSCLADRMCLVVCVDRRMNVRPDIKPIRVIAKLQLYDETHKFAGALDVTCSVAYEVAVPKDVDGAFTSGENDDESSRKYVKKIFQVYEYCVRIPYDGVFYTFRIAFRRVNGYDDDDYHDYELHIECEDYIQFDTYGRIVATLVDFFAYQRSKYCGVIDEFVAYGPKWSVYRKTIGDGVRSSLDCMALCNPCCVCGVVDLPDVNDRSETDDEETTVNGQSNEYDMLVTYMGLSLMAGLNSKLHENIVNSTDRSKHLEALKKFSCI